MVINATPDLAADQFASPGDRWRFVNERYRVVSYSHGGLRRPVDFASTVSTISAGCSDVNIHREQRWRPQESLVVEIRTQHPGNILRWPDNVSGFFRGWQFRECNSIHGRSLFQKMSAIPAFIATRRDIYWNYNARNVHFLHRNGSARVLRASLDSRLNLRSIHRKLFDFTNFPRGVPKLSRYLCELPADQPERRRRFLEEQKRECWKLSRLISQSAHHRANVTEKFPRKN